MKLIGFSLPTIVYDKYANATSPLPLSLLRVSTRVERAAVVDRIDMLIVTVVKPIAVNCCTVG